MIDVRQLMPRGNPQKILGIVISISVVLLVLWLFMVSRMDYQSADSGVSGRDRDTVTYSQERRDSVRVMMGKSDAAQVSEDRSSRMFFNAFTTFVVLMIILAGVWIWSRSKSGQTSSSKYFKDIGQHTIGQSQQLKVIEINNEIWVLGIGLDSVTLLHRYPKDQWKEPIPDDQETGSRSFYNMFSGKS